MRTAEEIGFRRRHALRKAGAIGGQVKGARQLAVRAVKARGRAR